MQAVEDLPGRAGPSGAVVGWAAAADPLTPRERGVAGLVAAAPSSRGIADRLVLSERTVESHVRRVLAELGLHRRTHLVLRAAALERLR